MVLESIRIVNYRSCKNVAIELKEETPNAFIGVNDCGKSTILYAMDLLLGAKVKYNAIAEGQNRSDLSNTPLNEAGFKKIFDDMKFPHISYSQNASYFLGVLKFADLEADNFADANLTTGIQWSLENSTGNHLPILKEFKGNQQRTFLLFLDSKDKNELWKKTQKDIDKLIKELKVTPEEIENENGKGRFSNLEKLRAVYAKIDTELIWGEHKFAKGDLDILPEFRYFDWNCSFDDINSLANSIMKEEIDQLLVPLKKTAKDSADLAEKKINKKFDELSETIRSVAKGVENINSKVHFEVKEKISDIMIKKSSSDGMIHLENQGEGLKRQIWFSLIKSKADTDPKNDINNFIWAFDEPETHLFPSAQREFFDILKRLSQGNVQTLISTHSTVFVDKSKLETIKSVNQNDDGYSEISFCKDIEFIYSTLGLKNSDFLFFDKFLVVEGDTEQHLIPELFKLYTGTSLLECNIQLINIQGKDKWTLNKAMLTKIMAGFKKSEDQVLYLFDNDMRFEIGEAAIASNMCFVGDQDIEDSILSEVWVELLNEKYKDDLAFTVEELDAIKDAIPKAQKCPNNQKFYSRIKSFVSEKWTMSGREIGDLIVLPSKGKESSDFLCSAIKTSEMIPKELRKAFDTLMN